MAQRIQRQTISQEQDVQTKGHSTTSQTTTVETSKPQTCLIGVIEIQNKQFSKTPFPLFTNDVYEETNSNMVKARNVAYGTKNGGEFMETEQSNLCVSGHKLIKQRKTTELSDGTEKLCRARERNQNAKTNHEIQ